MAPSEVEKRNKFHRQDKKSIAAILRARYRNSMFGAFGNGVYLTESSKLHLFTQP